MLKQILLGLLLSVQLALPAAFVTQRSGDVNVASDNVLSPWHDGGAQTTLARVPTSVTHADTVTIANGHTLNLPASITWSIGDSANPTTHSIRTAGTGGTGILTTQAGSTLTLMGDTLTGNATWLIGTSSGGAIWQWGHTATALTSYISDVNLQANSRIVFTGASGNRTIVRKATGAVQAGGFAGATTTIQDSGRVEGLYADFSGFGATGASGFRFRASTSAFTLSFKHVKFDNVGQFLPQAAAVHGATNWIFEDFEVTNPAGTGKKFWNGAFAAKTTGTRHFKRCFFDDTRVEMNPSGFGEQFGFAFEDVVMKATTIAPLHSANAHVGSFTNVLVYGQQMVDASSLTFAGLNVSGLYVIEGTTPANSHPLFGIKYTSTLDRLIMESPGGQNEGDLIAVTDSGTIAVQTLDFRHILVLQPTGGYYGVIVNMASGLAYNAGVVNYPNVTARNFTWRGGGSSGGSIQHGATGGENANNQGKAGLFADVSRHLCWSETAATPCYFTDYFGSSTGATPPANGTYTVANYNMKNPNITTGGGGVNYKYQSATPAVYGATPGTADVTLEPRFADTSRRFLGFVQSIDPTKTTVVQGIDEFAKLARDSGFDSRYNIANLIAWTMWGHVPQEARAWTACNGSYCGAVDPTPLKNAAAAAAGVI